MLIDEARTPLIISEARPDEFGARLYKQAIELAKRMGPEHYQISRNKEGGSARIDLQLFGRSGRQGQRRTVEAMVSLDDEMFVRCALLLRVLCNKMISSEGSVAPGRCAWSSGACRTRPSATTARAGR